MLTAASGGVPAGTENGVRRTCEYRAISWMPPIFGSRNNVRVTPAPAPTSLVATTVDTCTLTTSAGDRPAASARHGCCRESALSTDESRLSHRPGRGALRLY